MRTHRFLLVLAFAAAASLTACGGGKKAAGTASNAMQNGASAVSGAGAMAGNAAENAMGAAQPGSLHCGSQQTVWVNTHSHVYHLSGDPYYGHTKYGRYMCMQDAVNSGYHAAGSKGASSSTKHHHHAAAGSQAQPESSPSM